MTLMPFEFGQLPSCFQVHVIQNHSHFELKNLMADV